MIACDNLGRGYSLYNCLYGKDPICAREASLARTCERAAKPRGGLARAFLSREAHFAGSNRRTCSQATKGYLYRFQVYEGAGTLRIEGYERVGKSTTRHYLKRAFD